MGEYTKAVSGPIERGRLSWDRPSNDPEPALNWSLLDRVLELLKDSQWHSLKEIEEKISLPKEKFAPVIELFVELGLISHRDDESESESESESEVQIKPLGVKFLELPDE